MWCSPEYNRVGNMVAIPKSADPTNYYVGIYDAWNRLMEVKAGDVTVHRCGYDGVNRCVIHKSFVLGTLDETRHLYYTQPLLWQVVEERLGTSPDSASPDRQFIWGMRYIDACVLRDRDANGDGILDERLYALQDANWNVSSVAGPYGAIQERYNYRSYGQPEFLNDSFAERTSSACGWEILFAGYSWNDELRIYNVRRRVLHPSLGAWTTRDPIGYAGGRNLGQYVSAKPVSLVDPTGRLGFIVGGALFIAVGVLLYEFWPHEQIIGSHRPWTGTGEDQLRALECCGSDKVCKRQLLMLMEMVRSTDDLAMNEPPRWPDRCFRWCKKFVEKWIPGSSGKPIDFGSVSFELLEYDTPGQQLVVTQSSVGGVPIAMMNSHCIGKVKIKPLGGQECTAYFDLGYPSNQGEFGGEDQWFFDTESGFQDTFLGGGVQPFQR